MQVSKRKNMSFYVNTNCKSFFTCYEMSTHLFIFHIFHVLETVKLILWVTCLIPYSLSFPLPLSLSPSPVFLFHSPLPFSPLSSPSLSKLQEKQLFLKLWILQMIKNLSTLNLKVEKRICLYLLVKIIKKKTTTAKLFMSNKQISIIFRAAHI